MKNNQSENALVMLDSLSRNSVGLPLYYSDYLRGEIYLFKGEYLNSISSYRWFINHYNGQNGVKDAYYKIGLCYWLNGNTNDAEEIFKQAKSRGKEASEADKYAARSLAETELPHINLTKARYAIDGGYYEQATADFRILRSRRKFQQNAIRWNIFIAKRGSLTNLMMLTLRNPFISEVST